MKKIAFFIGSLEAGGAERVISILTKHLAEKGFDIQLLLYYDRPAFYKIDSRVTVKIIEKETGTKNIIKNAVWFRRYCKRNVCTLISFLAVFNMFALFSIIGLKIPVIVADRSDPRFAPRKMYLRLIRDFSYNFASRIVLQNADNKKYFSKAIQKKSVIIPNPVDLGDYAGIALKTEKKKKIVSVGRLIRSKNFCMLIESFCSIREKIPGYTLEIYGEGSERNNLEQLIEKLGLADCVSLPGQACEVFDKIKDARLFVFSSDFEGMPNALIEAMCLGLPVISTRVSGVSNLIQQGKNGVVVSVRNKQELADAMLTVLNDEDFARCISENAVQLNKKLSPEKIMGEWQCLIDL